MQNLKNKFTLVFLGRSGSGKGTQAKFVLKRLGRSGWHMETGRFLRGLMKKNNPTVLLAREVMDMGKLFPAWFAAYTWLKELIEKGAADKNLIYDGAPRRVWEAELLDEVMKWHARPLPIGVYVDVYKDEAVKRLLLRARQDDKKSTILNRMKFFDRDVLPVIAYYKKRGRLLRVDGNPPEEIVWRSLDKTLQKKLGRKWPKK